MRELGRGSVCLRCQLQQLVASRANARRGVSRWNSTSSIAATAEDDTPGTSETQTQTESSNPRSIPDLGRPSNSRTPRTPPSMARRPPPPHRTPSLAMFQSIVETRISRSGRENDAGAKGAASMELVKDVAKMQIMLEREGATLAAAYTFFEETVYPQIRDSGAAVPQIVKNQLAAVLLNKVVLEKSHDFESPDLPSVSRITEVMVELDIVRPGAWATLIIELIQRICRQSTLPDDYSSIEDYENAMARRDVLLRDLVGAWKAFGQQRSSARGEEEEAEEEKGDEVEPKPSHTGSNPPKTTLQKAFAAMFPQYLASTLHKPTAAAFATYKLLTDPFNRSRSIKEEAAPFLQMMKTLIFQSRRPRLQDFQRVLGSYPDLVQFLEPKKQVGGNGHFVLEGIAASEERSQNLGATIHRQLGQAIKGRNLGAVKRAWVDFWGEKPAPDASRIPDLVNCPEIFDYFILAYMMMGHPNLAIEAWNNMERIGIKATIKTWNSMLQGCAKAGNASGIHTVWEKAIASGIKFDTAIWTARIHGLFASKEPDAGLRALVEMAKVWADRENPVHSASAVQPSVEPVNAALAGLLRLGREADAKKVLTWAAKQGINPDIYTFNTLLRPLVRRGDMAAIDEVFATMRSVNIQADVATFTVLLEGALTGIGSLPPPQQVALVKRILSEMKSAGVEINMQTYAKILHLLLREGDRAGEPVKAVLAHIWRRGLELTSHIYTMLAQHYFSRDPPDAAAVTALIENRRLHENRGIDRVFWERVIKGYCAAGEVERALAIFDRVAAQGAAITFGTLHELLAALVAVGDGPAAARVVEVAARIGRVEEELGTGGGGYGRGHGKSGTVIESGGGGGGGAEGKRYWRHRFWHLAYAQGLMGEELAGRFREALVPGRV
ncbi:hypothetical protein VTK26DRAFT_6633 [Humicola hyalothermophila]